MHNQDSNAPTDISNTDMPSEIAGEATAESVPTDLRQTDIEEGVDTDEVTDEGTAAPQDDVELHDDTQLQDDVEIPGPTYRIDTTPGWSNIE